MIEPKGRGWRRDPASRKSGRNAGCAPISSASQQLLAARSFTKISPCTPLFDSPHKNPRSHDRARSFEPKYHMRSHSDLRSQDEHASTPSHGGVSQRHANMSAEQFVFPALSVRGGYGGPDRSSVTRGRLECAHDCLLMQRFDRQASGAGRAVVAASSTDDKRSLHMLRLPTALWTMCHDNQKNL
jgi:hypothetical protein